MIAFVRGKLADSLPHQAIVDVGGLGYDVSIPLSTYDRLPQMGQDVKLLTHYHVTDRGHQLFGFITAEERDLFRLLIDRVSGIGPKMALSVLSGMPVPAFKDAVIRADTAALAKISGVGKKTAERIVLELKDKVGVTDAWQVARSIAGTDPAAEAQQDAILALIALGYKQAEAQKTVQQVLKQPALGEGQLTADKIIREALRSMG
jgi:holliday junction DNA helicase RuvA